MVIFQVVRNSFNKLGWSILPHVECRPSDHRKDATPLCEKTKADTYSESARSNPFYGRTFLNIEFLTAYTLRIISYLWVGLTPTKSQKMFFKRWKTFHFFVSLIISFLWIIYLCFFTFIYYVWLTLCLTK